MPESSPSAGSRRFGRFTVPTDRAWTPSLIGSYVFDWVVLIIVGVVAGILALIEPNKRPFSLLDPNISFPFTEDETVPMAPLIIVVVLAPIVIILLICLLLVPGRTAPKGTPWALLWKRKLWELHVGYLGLALSLISALFVTNGLKNMLGRPRPDLLARCDPDLDNFSDYIVGGIARQEPPSELSQVLTIGMLVSADICRSTDSSRVDEGFRSCPSGHSSSAAAGLVYLSLFIASKFAVNVPFATSSVDPNSHSAFPSRLGGRPDSPGQHGDRPVAEHHRAVAALRRQAAAPPLYLLAIALVPFFTSVFIAGSRWFDFRHHAFDIIFGYLIGLIAAVFAFYYYHLPVRRGAGWAWAPRSHDKAWWSGVGSYTYATDSKDAYFVRPGDEEEALASEGANGFNGTATASGSYGSGSSTQVAGKEDQVPQQAWQQRQKLRNGASPDQQRPAPDRVAQGVDERDYYATPDEEPGWRQPNGDHSDLSRPPRGDTGYPSAI